MEFRKCKLGDFVDNVSDTTPIKKDKVILINTSDIENGNVLNHKYTDNENLKGQFKKRFKKGDILYSEIRPKNKRFAYVDFDSEDYIASTKLMILRNKSNIDNNFLFQILKSDNIINHLQMIAESRSGTFPQITFNELSNIEVYIPLINEQKKISNFLKVIDKKIKLNNQINNNLIEIGISLVNKYFNEVEDCEILGNIIKFNKGKKPKDTLEVKIDGYDKYLTIACLNGQELNYADPSKTVIANNDLLMVMDGASSGDVYYSDYGIVGSTLAKLDIIDENVEKEYIYFCLKKYSNLIKSKNTGSAIPHTDKVFVYSLEIPKIEIEKQQYFKVLLKNIQENEKENRNLEQLRDTLLPKLMNGEIDLENIEI